MLSPHLVRCRLPVEGNRRRDFLESRILDRLDDSISVCRLAQFLAITYSSSPFFQPCPSFPSTRAAHWGFHQSVFCPRCALIVPSRTKCTLRRLVCRPGRLGATDIPMTEPHSSQFPPVSPFRIHPPFLHLRHMCPHLCLRIYRHRHHRLLQRPSLHQPVPPSQPNLSQVVIHRQPGKGWFGRNLSGTTCNVLSQ